MIDLFFLVIEGRRLLLTRQRKFLFADSYLRTMHFSKTYFNRKLDGNERQTDGLAFERVNVTPGMRTGWLVGVEDETAKEKK